MAMTGGRRLRLIGQHKALLSRGAIVIAAILLTLPIALGPMRTNDSFWIDWVWVDQFARQLGGGELYPRWLAQSHAGLGSPVFYYYPPLAFYLTAPFVWTGLSVWSAILAMFFVAYVASGASMYWWLKDRGERPLLGTVLYLAAPYHAFNFYFRGAMAEFLATAIVPIVMLGLTRISERKRWAVPVTALGYGALICTHLPLALLASVFLFGPYALLGGPRDVAALGREVAALFVGVALAAIYLVPAFALGASRDLASLWVLATLRPSSWSVWYPALADLNAMRDVLLIAAFLAVPLIVIAIRARSGWAAFGLLCIALAIGVVPVFWDLPLLKSVQFPFRIMPIAEFAFATAVARAPVAKSPLILALLPLVMTLFLVTAPAQPAAISFDELAHNHPDVPENLPPGLRPYTWPSRWALNLAVRHHEPVVANGITTEATFYYPAWQVRCGGRLEPTFPAPGTQLLSYRGAGCEKSLRMTAPERWGTAISLAALLLLMVMSLAAPRLRRRR